MRWLPLLFALLLTACASPVVTDSQAGTDFRQYHSYTFVSDKPDAPKTLDDQRIETALDQALASKGLSPAASTDQADLEVKHFYQQEQRIEGSSVQVGFGFFRGPLGVSTSTPVEGETTRQYQLVVQLIDHQSGKVVWQATSRDRLDDMSTERRTQHLNDAVEAMFKRYPPES
ncbi:hypothetical protein A11A3_13660 [Alcanivorax hongdengensis A-11-3]|uniref:DUF4136 domain-containing protein n=1 Tax=Alcanivorax hongdengensis A-11-3 TaxID=1177179 RepID=L0W9J7_9GAMM|nr:DUF4136 domain-containing protein [Alcanivorax hongdengensis]EKF73403.1 hypothetical protein A11A3_13660 [Alcanivorax hongdengensis A-11-3]